MENPAQVRPDHPLKVLWRRKLAVLLMLALSVAAAHAYLALTPPRFTSSSELYYRHNAPRILDEEDPLPAGPDGRFLATEARVLQSPAVLAVAAGRLEESALELFAERDPIAALQDGLAVEVGRRDNILTVSFTGPRPDEARAIVAAIVEAYQTFQKDKRQQALDNLNQEREKITKALRAKNEELIAFKATHGAISFEDDANNVIMQRLGSLAEALTAAQLEVINAKAAYEEAGALLANDPALMKRVEAIRQAGTPISVGDQATLRQELFNLQQRMAEARRQYLPGHPVIQVIQGRLDELMVAYVGAARERWLASERRVRDLEASYEQQQKLTLEMQSRRQEYAQLNDELRDLQKLAAEMAGQFNRMTVVESVGPLSISVLKEADLPAEPSWPRRQPILIIGLVAGVVLGLGSALVLEWRDQTLRTADEVHLAVGAPVLGVIPTMPREVPVTARGRIAYIDPLGAVAEAYRVVRTAVHFGLPDAYGKTILITSPTAGEGRSTLVANLAIAMAQADRRVLIVDADLRMPVQHRIFGVEAVSGLAAVLRDGVAIDDAIVRTGVPNLDLLPCGPLPHNPSEILNSQAFSDLLGDLAARYDQVVLDSPPLMSVADARIAAAWCDATVLVLHAEKTNRKIAMLARDGLVAVGANVIGAVVNDVDRRSNRHGFHADFAYGSDAPFIGPTDPAPSAPAPAAPAPAAPAPAPSTGEPPAAASAPAAAGTHTPAAVREPAASARPSTAAAAAAATAHPSTASATPASAAPARPSTPAPAARGWAPRVNVFPAEPSHAAPTHEPAARPASAAPAPSLVRPAAPATPPATPAPAAQSPAAPAASSTDPATPPATPAPALERSLSEKLAETSERLRRSYKALRTGTDV